MFIPCGCYIKLPRFDGLKEIYSLKSLETRSQKSKRQWTVHPGGCCHSMAVCITPISAALVTWLLPFQVHDSPLPSLIQIPLIASKAHQIIHDTLLLKNLNL